MLIGLLQFYLPKGRKHSKKKKSKIKIPLTPALLTNASIRPNASHALSTDASIAGLLALTSSSTATARRSEVPYLLIWSQRDWSRSIRRAAAMILQPASAKSRQHSRPRPEEAPVTITTLPVKSVHGSNLVECLFAIDFACYNKISPFLYKTWVNGEGNEKKKMLFPSSTRLCWLLLSLINKYHLLFVVLTFIFFFFIMIAVINVVSVFTFPSYNFVSTFPLYNFAAVFTD